MGEWPDSVDPFPEWPNCQTPDCPNKLCMWSGLPLCFPCGERAMGREYMMARWTMTHPGISWEEAEA